MIKICCNVSNKHRNLETLKYHVFFKKILGLSTVYCKHGHDYKKICQEEPIEILKILGLITNIEEYQKLYNHVWRKHKSKI